MTYLTELEDSQEILKDSLVSDQKHISWKMSFADAVVILFDTTTWDGVDYKLLLNLVHKGIATHALHRHQCEKSCPNHGVDSQ